MPEVWDLRTKLKKLGSNKSLIRSFILKSDNTIDIINTINIFVIFTIFKIYDNISLKLNIVDNIFFRLFAL
ncbi:hypothetical protein NCCP133_27560 [Cytobacillus sp. NCCP-133]|nr:hypothetical protein NCCP133_27560 [Cytobacillus sp. NCCP-133]